MNTPLSKVLFKPRALSVESEAPDGKTRQELEYTFYGKLADMKQLERAYSKERQEQWLIPLDTDVKGKMRIRRIDDKRCILTTKLKNPALKGSMETECDIPISMFDEMKKFGIGGMLKTRYVFNAPTDNLCWEIDVFPNAEGQPSEWVKVDLEVKSEGTPFPPFPVDFLEFISEQPSKQSEEEKKFIKNLWENVWMGIDQDQKLQDVPADLPPKTDSESDLLESTREVPGQSLG